jgi:FMN-dependent NADH-azoreductase
VEGLGKSHPNAKVITRDVAKNPPPHLSPEALSAISAQQDHSPVLKTHNEVLGEFLAADIIVIEAPMYNFSLPSALKAWIDCVVRAGKTFKYTAEGPKGLVSGKKAILVLARGGIYTEGPYKAFEHQESYLKAVLPFIGITDIQTVVAEGTSMGPDKAAAALAGAKKQATKVAADV